MKFVVVDMQGFCIPEFFPKELSIYDGRRQAHFIIRSPIPLFAITDPSIISQIKYVQAHIHGLYYGAGDVSYEDLPAILQNHLENVDVVYVKGAEKRDFLLKIFDASCCRPEIRNLEGAWDCPKLEKEHAACLNHTVISADKKTRCSINNCRTLYSWLRSLLP